MDPTEFGISTLPLQHEPYPLISPETLLNANAGKVAIVTGAGQGIGAAIAESLAKSGASLAILDISTEKLQTTKKACEAHGVRVKEYACDVTDDEAVVSTFSSIENDLGPVDILVNNAGIIDQRPLLMSTFPAFWRQIEVNFKGPLLTTHTILPRFRDRGSGCIINIASRSGTVDVPLTLGYVTSKAALIRATHTLQREMELDNLDPGIHMYALHPGGVLSAIGGSGAAKDVIEKYGDVRDEEFFMQLFKDQPSLCGQTCAFLASGRGKELRGLYLDCRQDLGKLLSEGRDKLLKAKLNTLTVNFLDGYCNEP
ncbi:short chain dehydrogenase/reductase-like protein SDR [Westerdykella ornata]|uniref:Short chain dehydrogenase/reductase-like protein SDR n=1 Tax=Westerdykella ornata TaxID=318751 RepID=A0A6A6JQS4_WESOR|nr:short chain dehydrogenase/reductase-like protein SDR [Westerdykella ornata]KAF2278046.1 short chain dehydrogenase/reductase-like protein SDR [Westerdykella ornata]